LWCEPLTYRLHKNDSDRDSDGEVWDEINDWCGTIGGDAYVEDATVNICSTRDTSAKELCDLMGAVRHAGWMRVRPSSIEELLFRKAYR